MPGDGDLKLLGCVRRNHVGGGMLTVVAVLTIVAGIVRIVLLSMTIDSPGDGPARAIMAYAWSKNPYFATSGVWLPGFMYLSGLVDLLIPDPMISSRLLNVFLGTLTIPVFYVLVERIYGRGIAVFSSLLLSVLPFHAGISASSLSEASYIFKFLVFPPVYQEMSETPHSSVFVTRIKPAEIEQVAFWLKESNYKYDYILMTPMGWRSTYLSLYYPQTAERNLIVSNWIDDSTVSDFIKTYHSKLFLTCERDEAYVERVEKLMNHSFTDKELVYTFKDVRVFRVPPVEIG